MKRERERERKRENNDTIWRSSIISRKKEAENVNFFFIKPCNVYFK